MRLFVTSDLHIDYKVNRDWLSQLSDQDYQEDALVVAGDLADSRDLTRPRPSTNRTQD